ncbi:hypothetical protein [Oceanobacillus oncorhynchi]|uniref:hypothetical protein n=1 Tax=Oceanobacillus oncorhynchi TaxID=545501 RepID=UPI0025A342E3|nr:hypothetical protein [Oceanobacillus oncorhynchi]MDM8100944.1 hypothetical protein [Oceanobacillus oncorhynchi]
MAKQSIILSEKDIARIINGGEVSVKVKDEEVIIRQSYMKDIAADMLIRTNRVMNTRSKTFEY